MSAERAEADLAATRQQLEQVRARLNEWREDELGGHPDSCLCVACDVLGVLDDHEAPLDDPEAWAQANPGLGYTVSESAIRAVTAAREAEQAAEAAREAARQAEAATPMAALTGKLSDPKFRTERARKAARASHTATAAITRFLHRLPELSDEQIETVRAALPPVTNTADVRDGDGAKGQD